MTTDISSVHTAKARHIAFPFHARSIIKRTVVAPRRFSAQSSTAEDPEEIAAQAAPTDVFALPNATALRTNMGSIIIPAQNPVSPAPPTLAPMRESNIFFNFERRGSASTAASPAPSALSVYITADEQSPLARLGAATAASARASAASPLCRKAAGAPAAVALAPLDTDTSASLSAASLSRSDDSTMVVSTPEDTGTPQGKAQPVLGLTTQFLDSADSLVENTGDSPAVWPTGTGPCRVCGGAVETRSASGDRTRRAVHAAELHGQWHRGCFTCSDCAQPLSRSQPCYVHGDMPYCGQHYHARNGSLCAICHTGVEGECLENHKHERFHTECLRCYVCRQTIQQQYSLINDTIAICAHHDLQALAEQGVLEF